MKEYFTKKDAHKLINDNSYDGNIVIPEGITVIDIGAFEGCTSLSSVTIPDSVVEIHWYAFKGCTSLTSLTIPDSVVEIYERAFEGCTSLQKLQLSNSLKTIGQKAFKECTSLTTVTIPDSVVRIYDHAFEGCTALESVVINKDILIDYCAFLKCNRLQLTDKIEKTYMEMCGCCGKDINTRKDACLKIITNYGYDHYMCSTCGTRNENLDKHCLVCECSACIDNRGWARCLDCRIDDPEYGRNIPDYYAVGTEWINKGV